MVHLPELTLRACDIARPPPPSRHKGDYSQLGSRQRQNQSDRCRCNRVQSVSLSRRQTDDSRGICVICGLALFAWAFLKDLQPTPCRHLEAVLVQTSNFVTGCTSQLVARFNGLFGSSSVRRCAWGMCFVSSISRPVNFTNSPSKSFMFLTTHLGCPCCLTRGVISAVTEPASALLTSSSSSSAGSFETNTR